MEKYEYIEKVIKLRDLKSNKKTKFIEETDINLFNIQKDTLKILKSNLKKYEKTEKVDRSYNNFKKKANVVKIYLNLAFFAISLRYIEIITKVKNGGNFFLF
jgi:hypothetical protein